MKAILIDDEQPALQVLEFLLSEYDDVLIAGSFTDPALALEQLPGLNADMIFLDINMPQMQGIDVASRILELSPRSEIIFVTAYDEYALEAFEVHALDYILKPVDPERLDKTIRRLRLKCIIVDHDASERAAGETADAAMAASAPVQIRCLGSLRVGLPEQSPVHWRSDKTRELFAFLLHHQGRELSRERILDTLWLDVDPAKAVSWLYNGIYYIRKALEGAGISRDQISLSYRQTASYLLHLGNVDWDVEQFKELTMKDPAYNLDLDQLLILYQGDYLESLDYPWALVEREILASRYLASLLRLAERYRADQRWNLAERALLLAYHQNPLDERVTELLLDTYRQTGDKIKLQRHYENYARHLLEELGTQPGGQVMKLIF